MEELMNLESLIDLIPENCDQEFEINGNKLSVKRSGNVVEVKVEMADDKFDDSEIKALISEYKENLEALDDQVFLDSVESLKKRVDIREFNDLLDLDSFTEEEAATVESYINESNDIIRELLKTKLDNMCNLFNRF